MAGLAPTLPAVFGLAFIRFAGPSLGNLARESIDAWLGKSLPSPDEWLLIGPPAVLATEHKNVLTTIGASDGLDSQTNHGTPSGHHRSGPAASWTVLLVVQPFPDDQRHELGLSAKSERDVKGLGVVGL